MNEVSVPNGRIRYLDEGQGTPLVFLHGSLVNAQSWRKVVGPLSRHFRCIAPDLPLGGHSIPFDDAADLTPPGIALIIDQFLEALGLEEVVLVGNDTGGAYAQVYAARRPEKVAALILSNCDAFEVFPPRHFASVQLGVRIPGYTAAMALLFRSHAVLTSPMVLGLLSHRLTGAEIRQLYARHFIEHRGVRRDFVKLARGWDPRHTQEAARELARFPKPALLIWGEDDRRLFPRALGERLAEVLPQARLELVPGARTYVQEDQPDAFVAHVLAFLARERGVAAEALAST